MVYRSNFIRVANLKFFPESYSYMIIEAFRDGMLTSSSVPGALEISLVKELSHIANPLLKIMR